MKENFIKKKNQSKTSKQSKISKFFEIKQCSTLTSGKESDIKNSVFPKFLAPNNCSLGSDNEGFGGGHYKILKDSQNVIETTPGYIRPKDVNSKDTEISDSDSTKYPHRKNFDVKLSPKSSRHGQNNVIGIIPHPPIPTFEKIHLSTPLVYPSTPYLSLGHVVGGTVLANFPLIEKSLPAFAKYYRSSDLNDVIEKYVFTVTCVVRDRDRHNESRCILLTLDSGVGVGISGTRCLLLLLGNWAHTPVDVGCEVRIAKLGLEPSATSPNPKSPDPSNDFDSDFEIPNHPFDPDLDPVGTDEAPIVIVVKDDYRPPYGIVIVNPRRSVSCTNVISAISCPRRGVLSQKFPSVGQPPSYVEAGNEPFEGFEDDIKYHDSGPAFDLTYGKLAHKVFQTFIQRHVQLSRQNGVGNEGASNRNLQTSHENRTSRCQESLVESCTKSAILEAGIILDIFFHDLDLGALVRKMESRRDDFLVWASRYIGPSPTPLLIISATPHGEDFTGSLARKKPPRPPPSRRTSPNGAYYLEGMKSEHYLESKIYGIKGFLDMVVTLTPSLHRRATSSPPSALYHQSVGTIETVLELKTGRVSGSVEHKAQVMLYALMLNHLDSGRRQRYARGRDQGLLLYLDRDKPIYWRKPAPVATLGRDRRPDSCRKFAKIISDQASEEHGDNGGLTLSTVPTGDARHLIGLIQTRNELAYYAALTLAYDDGRCFVNEIIHNPKPPGSADEYSPNPYKHGRRGIDDKEPTVPNDHTLPDVSANKAICQRCPQLHACALTSASFKLMGTNAPTTPDIEDYQPSGKEPIVSVHQSSVAHLTPPDLAYFSKWYALLHLECQFQQTEHSMKSSAQTYLLLPDEGTDHVLGNGDVGDRIIRLSHVLTKNGLTPNLSNIPDFSIGQTVRLTPELEKIPGYNRTLSSTESTLVGTVISSGGTDSLGPVLTILLSPDSKSSVSIIGTSNLKRTNMIPAPIHFSVEPVELSGAGNHSTDRRNMASYLLSAGLGNLAELMRPGSVNQRLRGIIIHREGSELLNRSEREPNEYERYVVAHNTADLNDEQQRAIMGALVCERFALIKGLPGSGKTETIVRLITICRSLGLSVLVTAHTNSAIDNVLLKLISNGVRDVIRFGGGSHNASGKGTDLQNRNQGTGSDYNSKVPAPLHPYCLTHARIEEICKPMVGYGSTRNENCQATAAADVGKLGHFLSGHSVYAATCFTVARDPLIRKLKYDICIVDEASQIFQPLTLAPLLTSHRFVLVGDSNQLPPVVRNRAAASRGADQSLFSLLESADPPKAPIFELTYQYRMNHVLMRLSNHALVLNGRLRCGNDSVSRGTISDDLVEKINSPSRPPPSWIVEATSPNIDDSIIFIDTDGCEGGVPSTKISQIRNNTLNLVEVGVMEQLLRSLVDHRKIDVKDIGIMALYRDQVDAIKTSLINIVVGGVNFGDVEVNTIDQFQGRDKSVVLLSLTVKNDEEASNRGLHNTPQGSDGPNHKSTILGDRRRLNVAFTRARHKFIMVGSKCTVWRHYPLLKCVLTSVLTNKHIINIVDHSV